VASARHQIEQLLEEAKGSAGLADYEVRYWHSWYRHMTLALVAHAFITLLRHADTQKKSGSAARLVATEFC
jgi:SRSO17 transposase